MQLVSPRLRWLMRYAALALSALLLIAVVACVGPQAERPEEGNTSSTVLAIAKANIVGTDLVPDISGQISLQETAAGLKMQGTMVNVPAGMHGFHIHEGSSCDEGGKAAGGHFNPRQVAHGHLPSMDFDSAHAGDLGNLQANSRLGAELDLELPGLTLSPGEFSVANRAFIMHADPDDLSQPTGNAGARIACGIIQPIAQAQ